MAQVYKFIDENGVTRLFAEISPEPAGTAFNGGTITQPLVVNDPTGFPVLTARGGGDPVADGNLIFVLQAGDALPTSVLGVFSDGTTSFTLDATSPGLFRLQSSGAPGNVFTVTGDGKVGFYNHAAVALQTGVAVNAAGIHAALVNLGLITA